MSEVTIWSSIFVFIIKIEKSQKENFGSMLVEIDELCAWKMAHAKDMIKLKPVIRHVLIQLGDMIVKQILFISRR